MEYKGRYHVAVEGVRKHTIPLSDVRKLIGKLGDEDFFHWAEKDQVCLDFPEVHITAILNGQRKQVLEGCNSPGKVLELADEIDKISGTNPWVGKLR